MNRHAVTALVAATIAAGAAILPGIAAAMTIAAPAGMTGAVDDVAQIEQVRWGGGGHRGGGGRHFGFGGFHRGWGGFRHHGGWGVRHWGRGGYRNYGVINTCGYYYNPWSYCRPAGWRRHWNWGGGWWRHRGFGPRAGFLPRGGGHFGGHFGGHGFRQTHLKH
jgi:hypothetical protein